MGPLLIERAGELEALRRVRRSVLGGRGGYVHVVGQAGIGKTSLLDAATAELADHGVRVLRARADETDRRRSLGVVRRLLPDLGDPDDAVDAALASIERRASEGPIALVVDDLHWVDERSLDVVWATARRAGDLGVVLVTASWPQASNVHVRLEDLAVRDGACLRPQPLDALGLASLAEHQLGATPSARLVEALAGTAGNPFLASELLHSWAADGSLRIDAETVDLDGLDGDDPIADGLSRRLAMRALTAVPGSDLMLRAIAAAPGGARPDELAALMDRPLCEVVQLVLDVIESGVLVDNAGDALTFRHDLLRRAIVESTPRSVIRSLGAGFADVLLRTNADPDRIAACLVGNADPDDPPDVDRLVEIARRFRPTHPSAAADVLRIALDSLAPFDHHCDRLVVELGWALVAAGRTSEVHPLVAERLGPHRDDEPTEVHRLRGIAASLSGQIELVATRYAELDPDNLHERFDPNDPEVVDALAEFGLLRISTGDVRAATQIVDWVDRSPTPASQFRIATVATVRAFVATVGGAFEVAEQQSRVALAAAARDTTARASTATPNLVLAMSLDFLGRGDEALDAARAGIRRSTPRWGPPLLQCFSALVLYRRGAWDDALAEVDASLVAAEEAQLAMAVFWPSAVATLISCARDRSGSAHEWLARLHKVGGRPNLGAEWIAIAAAAVAEADGEHGSALVWTEMVADGIIAANAPAMLLNGGPELVRRCLHAGHVEPARRIAASLATVRSRTASPVAGAVSSWADGLVDGDAAAVEAAADELLIARRIPEAARALHHAAVLAARSDHDEASRIAKLAFEHLNDLDAQQWRRQLIAELRAAGLHLRPRQNARRATTGWASLTPSEEAVVALVGDGLTNAEIADRLFVSRRTVESHLVRVYPKLALSSRIQLVAAVVRRADAGATP